MMIGVIAGGVGGLAAGAMGATAYLMLVAYGQGIALLVALAGAVVTWVTGTLVAVDALKRFIGE